MFDAEELNEIASLLHITSEIMSNHPNLQGIARTCLRRLGEIEAEQKDAEAVAVEASNKAAADAQAKAYVAPKPGDANYIAPEKVPSVLDQPIGQVPDPNAGVEVERRV